MLGMKIKETKQGYQLLRKDNSVACNGTHEECKEAEAYAVREHFRNKQFN